MIKPFKFWAQHVLPLVYDDSLSYYEVLSKIAKKLNETIDAQNILGISFEDLKKYVEEYFEGLVVDTAVSNKIDEMVQDGTLAEIINQEAFTELSNKIQENTDAIEEMKISGRYIFPEDFGAKGDGITDDTNALQEWADALKTTNKIGALGGGVYLVLNTIHIYANNEPTIYMNGSTIKSSISNSGDVLYVGELYNIAPFECKLNVIGPGTIDCNNTAETGLRISQYVHNGFFDNLNITKVHKYGIYGEGTDTLRNVFSNINIYGPYTKINDVDTYGFYFSSWDHTLSNIATYSVAKGIYAAGGILLTNYHHWSNVAKYTSLQYYSETYAVSTFRGQLENLYIDAYNGIVVTGNNSNVQIANLHIEAAGVDYGGENNYPWLLEIVGVRMPSVANITINGFYWAPHGGEKTKLIPVYVTSTTGHVIQQSGLQINDYSKVSGYAYQHYVQTVSEGNNIYLINKPVSLFYRVVPDTKNSGRYLIGYVRDGLTYFSLEDFEIKINNTSFRICISSNNNPTLLKYETSGQNANFGRLCVGQSTAITNLQVRPLYYEPGFNGGTLPSYSAISISPIGFNGVAGLYPVQGVDAGTLEISDTQSFDLSIPLIKE